MSHMTVTFPAGLVYPPPDDPTAGVREPALPAPIAPTGAVEEVI